ncbi:MAG: thiol:disulfide interchange protein DsbA/DsbL [Burkholderiales bacterium]
MFKHVVAGVAGLIISLSAFAQGAPASGIDYVELNPPQATDSPGKVEVIEFFWYRCPHCYALEPTLENWLKRLPRDAQFKRVPAIFNEEWAIDARIFYALEALGEVERLHRPLFDAIHQQGGVTQHGDAYAKWVADWLSKHGVDAAKYDAVFHSFTVESKLRRAAQMTQAYRIDGVPTLAVQGRYVVSATMSGERQVMLKVTDYLIGEARKQLAKTKS